MRRTMLLPIVLGIIMMAGCEEAETGKPDLPQEEEVSRPIGIDANHPPLKESGEVPPPANITPGRQEAGSASTTQPDAALPGGDRTSQQGQ